jgi:glycerophosphoryl diester phosphodiesterase
MLWIGGLLGVTLALTWSYLVLRWIFAVPAFVGEGYRGREALRRSYELTVGHWLRIGGSIAGLTLLLGVVAGVSSSLARDAVLRASGSAAWLAVWLGLNFLVGIALAVLTFVVLQAYVLSSYLRARGLPTPSSSNEPMGRSAWVSLGLLAAGAVAVGALGLLAGALVLARPVAPGSIQLVAHRAGEAYAPENTVAAVKQARADKADRLEFDVQRTSDGKLVVVHDSDLLRLSGKDVSIGGSTLAQVQAVDIGKGEHVPTLEAFLDAAGTTPLALEIKTHAGDQQSTKEVVAMLQKRGAIDRTVLLSLDPEITRLAHGLDPKLRTADLVSVAVGEVALLPADVIAPTSAMASSVFVAIAHSAGKEVWVWSVEDDAMVREAAIRGVDGIITSDVPKTRRTLAEMGSLSTEEVRRKRIDDLLNELAQ